MYDEFLFKAVQYFGSQKELADALHVSQQAVNHWLNRSNKIPYLQALKIDLYTEGKIRMEDLNDEEKELTFLLKHSSLLKKAPVAYLPFEKIVMGGKRCPVYTNFRETIPPPILPNTILPILVSSDNKLIACECRLRSYKSVNSKVKVYRLNAEEMLKNKANIENLLEDFPISERVEVGIFIEQELGDRRGKRTDLELPENFPEVAKKNGETRQIAAEVARFGNYRTYYQAKAVVKKGLPELIKAMDGRLIAVSKASQIANLPEEEQHLFMAMIHQPSISGE